MKQENAEGMTEDMQKDIIYLAKGSNPDLTLGELQELMEDPEKTIAYLRKHGSEILEQIRKTTAEIADFVASSAYTALKKELKDAGLIGQILSNFALKTASDILSLMPYIEREIAENPAFNGYSIEDVYRHGFNIDGSPAEGKYKPLIEKAIERREAARVHAVQTRGVEYPLDKPNSIIWNCLTTAEPNGQIQRRIDTSKKSKKSEKSDLQKKAFVYYGLDFSEIENEVTITKQLTPFDKRVYIAAAALYNAGNKIFSASQIYAAIGNTGRPKTEQVKKINDALTKMGSAHLFLDNNEEIKVYKGIARFKYDSALLPFERTTAYINGQYTDSAIHLFREPPLISFAKERKQVTTIPLKVLQSPINKTAANLQIEDYLIERIGRMKRPGNTTPRKILFSTIYKSCSIKTKKQKQRTPETICRYLDHYKAEKWIIDYTQDKSSVTIEV